MAFLLADRVKETSVSPGAGTANLAGPVQGHQSFVQGVGNGNICTYCMTDGVAWEVGYGLVTSGNPDTLQRVTIIRNSAQGTTPINFTGTVDVFVTAAGAKLMSVDNNGKLPFLDGLTSHVLADGGSNNLFEVTANGATVSNSSGNTLLDVGPSGMTVSDSGGPLLTLNGTTLNIASGIDFQIDGASAITDADIAGNVGYMQFGPMLFNWGSSGSLSNAAIAVTFSRAFSAIPKAVLATVSHNTSRVVTVDDLTVTGFNAYTWRVSDGLGNVNPGFDWLAIGLA